MQAPGWLTLWQARSEGAICQHPGPGARDHGRIKAPAMPPLFASNEQVTGEGTEDSFRLETNLAAFLALNWRPDRGTGAPGPHPALMACFWQHTNTELAGDSPLLVGAQEEWYDTSGHSTPPVN
jgi:hypothetical protein